jgi:hypothetical protein
MPLEIAPRLPLAALSPIKTAESKMPAASFAILTKRSRELLSVASVITRIFRAAAASEKTAKAACSVSTEPFMSSRIMTAPEGSNAGCIRPGIGLRPAMAFAASRSEMPQAWAAAIEAATEGSQ